MDFGTYSFQDVIVTFKVPYFAAFSSTGAGLGSISIVPSTTKTIQDVAADGRVMISKVAGNNGTIAITMQQNSLLHKNLLNWYNYINTTASTSDWASTTVIIANAALGEKTTATGVSPQKLADKPYQAQGQMITWTLMAANIHEENI
jgi:hypothetical protein